MTPGGGRGEPAEALQLRLSLVADQPADDRPQVLEVQQRQPGVVGVVEDQPERALLRRVEVEHLRQQHRARSRSPSPAPAPRGRCRPATGTRPGRPVGTQSSPVCAARSVTRSPGAPGWASPLRSPLTSASTTGTPAADSCSAISCSVFVLPVPVAPAMSPCRLSIASGSRTWAAGVGAAAVHHRAELERRPRRRRSPAAMRGGRLASVVRRPGSGSSASQADAVGPRIRAADAARLPGLRLRSRTRSRAPRRPRRCPRSTGPGGRR